MEGISVRDGRYADYTEAGERFNAAITDCIVERCPLIVPGGAYDFYTPIVLPGWWGVALLGVGWQTELNAMPDLNDYVIRFSDGETRGARFENFTINGNCRDQRAGGGIWAGGAVESWFEKIHFHGCFDWALRTGGVGGENPTFGHHNTVRDNLIDGGSVSAGLGSGILNYASDENTFECNRLQDLGGMEAMFLGLEIGGAIDAAGITRWSNNSFVNIYGDGLRIKDTGRVRVRDNDFDGVRRASLIISGDQCLAEGNVYLEGGEGQSYVVMNNGSRNRITNESFSTPKDRRMRSAVREMGGATRNVVTQNTLDIRTPFTTVPFERRSPLTGMWRDNGWNA